MKNLFCLALIKSATICHSELGKLLCQILSASKAKSPRPSLVSIDDYFTSNHQLALYLHRSDSCTKKYRLKGYIPFVNEGGSILVKKSDVDNAVKLFPHLIALSPVPARSVPRIFARLVETEDKRTVIYFTFQHRECLMSVDSEEAKSRNQIHTLCRQFIQIIHHFKPFKIAPAETKFAA